MLRSLACVLIECPCVMAKPTGEAVFVFRIHDRMRTFLGSGVGEWIRVGRRLLLAFIRALVHAAANRHTSERNGAHARGSCQP
jgi:hypothetical protein